MYICLYRHIYIFKPNIRWYWLIRSRSKALPPPHLFSPHTWGVRGGDVMLIILWIINLHLPVSPLPSEAAHIYIYVGCFAGEGGEGKGWFAGTTLSYVWSIINWSNSLPPSPSLAQATPKYSPPSVAAPNLRAASLGGKRHIGGWFAGEPAARLLVGEILTYILYAIYLVNYKVIYYK